MKPFNSHIAEQLEAYVAYRKDLGFTDKHLRSTLRPFGHFVEQTGMTIQQAKPLDFMDFKKSLKREPRSITAIIIATRGFFDYLIRIQQLEDNPLKDFPMQRENAFVPFIFSPLQTRHMLAAIYRRIRKEPKHFLNDLTVYTAIFLLIECGLRLSEPLGLKNHHYRKDDGTLYIELVSKRPLLPDLCVRLKPGTRPKGGESKRSADKIERFETGSIEKTKFRKDRLIALSSTVIQHLNLFLPFAARYHQVRIQDLQVQHLSFNVIVSFPDHIEDQRNNSPRTRNQRLAAIKSFAKMIGLMYPDRKDIAQTIRNIPQKRAQALTRHGIHRMCKKYLGMALPEKRRKTLSPAHSFRHSCAVNMLSQGKDLTEIKNRLDHEKLETTMGYLRLDLHSKKELQKTFIEFTTSKIAFDKKVDTLIYWEAKEKNLGLARYAIETGPDPGRQSQRFHE